MFNVLSIVAENKATIKTQPKAAACPAAEHLRLARQTHYPGSPRRPSRLNLFFSQLKFNNPQSSISSSSPSESFLWDNLALLKRNDTLYIIESHSSGGIPIASHPVGKPEEITYHLNDLLGTTLATVGPAGVSFSRLTSFGQPLKSSASGSSLDTDAPSSPANPVPTTNQLPPTKQ